MDGENPEINRDARRALGYMYTPFSDLGEASRELGEWINKKKAWCSTATQICRLDEILGRLCIFESGHLIIQSRGSKFGDIFTFAAVVVTAYKDL